MTSPYAFGVTTSGPDGAFLEAGNNLSDVQSAGTSRANLHVPVLADCQAATSASVNISSPGSTFDGFTLSSAGADQILLIGQTSASLGSQNGPWVWNGPSTALSRPTDFYSGLTLNLGKTVRVENGGQYGNTEWSLNASSVSPVTVDTSSQTWRVLSPSILANVMTYGATGNGTTDDTVAIQAAANSGLPIYFPGGTYKWTTAITLPQNPVVRGAGSGQFFSSGITPSVAVLEPSGCHGFVLTNNVENGGVIEDVQLHGSNATGFNAIHVPNASSFVQCEVTIQRVVIQDFAGGSGVYFGSNQGGLTVRGSTVYACEYGLFLVGSDTIIDGNLLLNNSADGIVLQGAVTTVVNNSIGENQNNGINVDSSFSGQGSIIAKNGINDSFYNGIVISAQGGLIITDNIFRANSKGTDNTYFDVYVNHTTGQPDIIANNDFLPYTGEGTNKAAYNVGFVGSAISAIGGGNNPVSGSSHSGFAANAATNFVPGAGALTITTTPSPGDNSNLIADTAFVAAAIAAGGGSGLPATVAPLGGQLATTYNTTGSFATFLTTSTIPLGYWRITLVASNKVENEDQIAIQAAASTAVYTVIGGNTQTISELTPTSATLQSSLVISFDANVTTAGTIVFQAKDNGGGGNATIYGNSTATGYTGWTADPIGGNISSGNASVGGTSGSVTFSQPFQTVPYKKTLGIVSSGFTSAGGIAWTYPTAFTAIAAVTSPAIAGASVTATLTAASVTVASALGVQALIAIEGY